MNAEILSIGTELLLGEIVDTNAAFLAEELAGIGVGVYWIAQVGDNPGRLADAFERALQRSDLVITTGGLGPTGDDLTREAIAQVLGEEPRVDPALEAELRGRFASMHRPMPERNLKQAWLIPSAEALPNPLGTAPGWWVRTPAGRIIAAMPGVPTEMRGMWANHVRPRLERASGAAFASVTLKTLGLGESAVEERLGDLVTGANPSVATYAKRDGVHVRVAARADTRQQASDLVAPVVESVRARLGEAVYGEGEDLPAAICIRLLVEKGLTVAAAESITGGLVCSYLTDVPGSSKAVLGGVVAYQEAVKTRFGVPPDTIANDGIVSSATALAMAQAARDTFGADIGLGTTGAAGPDAHGGVPPGTSFVAVAGPDISEVQEVRRLGTRDVVKHFVALSALDLMRRALRSERVST